MTNLPITTSAPPSAAASRQTTTAPEGGDAQNNAPFGAVLARQINGASSKDKQSGDKAAVGPVTQSGADATAPKGSIDLKGKDTAGTKPEAAKSAKTDAAAGNGAATPPADMLAAMLPPAVTPPVNAGTTPSGGTTSKEDANRQAATILAAGGTNDKQGLSLRKPDAVDPGGGAEITNPAATAVHPGAQVNSKTFAAALANSSDHASGNVALHAAAEKPLPAQAAAQPNPAALASLQGNAAVNMAAPLIQPAQVALTTPVNQGKWGDEFSQKITWLASSNKDQTAELHLNPPHLGPLDVVLKISGDQATALFTSPHAAVRDAVEQAMPKLREMMADNGIMLGNATVSDQTPRDQGQPQPNTQHTPITARDEVHAVSMSAGSAARVSQISRHNGIVDTFA